MAGEKVIRPVDVIGRLPEVAAKALLQQNTHRTPIIRLGAVTFDELDLFALKAPTVDARQVANDLAGLVIFAERFSISKGIAKAKTHVDLSPEIRLLAKGYILHLQLVTQYIGAYVDSSRAEVKWIALPSNPEKWFNEV